MNTLQAAGQLTSSTGFSVCSTCVKKERCTSVKVFHCHVTQGDNETCERRGLPQRLKLKYTRPTSIWYKLCCILWGGVCNSIQLLARVVADGFLGTGEGKGSRLPLGSSMKSEMFKCVCVCVLCATADHCLHDTRRRHLCRHFQFSNSSIRISGSRGNSNFDIRLWRQMRATLATHRAVGR